MSRHSQSGRAAGRRGVGTTFAAFPAFTLVELLVVIGIIALLISILMPALTRARYQAQVTACAARQQQFAQAANIYAANHKGHYPRFDTPAAPNLWDVSTELYDVMRRDYRQPHEMFFCTLSREDLVDSFWKEPEGAGFYRAGYFYWIPRRLGAFVLPPGPGDGSGLQTLGPGEIRGPTKQGDPMANRNPIMSDVVLTEGSFPVNFDSDLSKIRVAQGLYPYSNHIYNRGTIESINVAWADGHVERVPAGSVKPRFLSPNNYWNWR